jgi:two-component system chemotaxis response regulator CheB
MARVLIIDDSVFMRTIIKDMISKDPAIEVVGSAVDGVDGVEKIKALRPDLITLDIEMPRMNGLDVLKEIARLPRKPKILMLSTLTSKGAEMTHEAIRLGADDFMLKPKNLPKVREITDDLVAKIKHLVSIPVKEPLRKSSLLVKPADRLVLIGSSAGGPQLLDTVLAGLPEDLPAAVVVTQHMPVGFTAPLAERFNRLCHLAVKETENGDVLETGSVYVSKAGYHTLVTGHVTGNGCKTGKIIHSSAPPMHGVRPAVDKTFYSAAQVYGKNIVSVVLSGMGNDAGEGAKAIKQAGGTSYICDEKDCLVYGMARSVISHDAVDKVIPLDKIAEHLARTVMKMEGTCV